MKKMWGRKEKIKKEKRRSKRERTELIHEIRNKGNERERKEVTKKGIQTGTKHERKRSEVEK